MNKPKLFVCLTKEWLASPRILDKLSGKFSVDYWLEQRRPTREELKRCVEGVYGIVCTPQVGMIEINSEVINAAGENLKVVATISVGCNHLDIPMLKAKGIRIGTIQFCTRTTETVAEYTIGLLLAVSRQIANNCLLLRSDAGSWTLGTQNFSQHQSLLNSVVGIIGCGGIGIAVARRLQTFGLQKLVYNSRTPKLEVDSMGGELRSVDDLCKESDFIIITTQLNEQTRHLINRTRLDSMKSNAVIVNVARGGIIDQRALVEVLQNGKIAGAGLDVVDPEPMKVNDPLLHLKNVVITPHVAWCTAASRNERLNLTVENILAAYENRKMPSELM